jgi:hypothetical protein
MSRRFLVLLAVVWAPLLVWWAALFPGGISNDTLDSWTQIKTGHWASHHPPPFTAFFWLTSLGGTTPATTSLVETLLVAAALAWFALVLDQVLRVGRAVYVAAFALGALPLVGPFSVTIWKDVPETAVLVVLAGLLVLAWHRELPIPRRWWAVVAGFSLAAGLLRWNGGATLAVAGVIAVIALKGTRRWWMGLATAGGGLAGTGVLLLLPHLTGITPVQPVDSQAEQLADLAQFARNTPQSFTSYDRAVLGTIAPFSEWRSAGYSCVTVDTVTYYMIRYEHLETALRAEGPALSHLWRKLAKKQPGELLHARVCRASLAWSFGDPPRREIPTVQPAVSPNDYGLHQLSPAPLRHAARRYAELSNDRWVQVLFWRPALWMLLTVLAAAVAGLGAGRWRLLLLFLAVPFGVVLSYAVEPAAQDARYTYAATVICQIVTVAHVAGRLRRRRDVAALA